MSSGHDREGAGDRRGVEVAATLMRMALALLDRHGAAVTAARLAGAIDSLSTVDAPEIGVA